MTTHELKVWPAYYARILAGTKRAEARWGDDRQYAAGDWCWFREYDPSAKAYTGNSCQARVRAAERVAPAAFGATGDALWLIELDEVSGIASAAILSPIHQRALDALRGDACERTAGGGLVMSEETRATVGALRAEEADRLPWVGTITVTDPPAAAPRCAACGGTGKEPAPPASACPDWGPCRACQGRGAP